MTAHAAAASQLATTWCGTERRTDYTASSLGSLPQVKVVYAYPSDAPDRFNALKDWLQADVAAMADRVAAAAGSAETIRFDVGTDCPSPLSYVDIAVLQLPQTAAQLQAMAWPDRGAAIRQAVLAQAGNLNLTGGLRHYAVFADDTLPASGDRTSGVGERPTDASPDPGNLSNGDGLVANIFGEGGNPTFIPPPSPGADTSDYMLHEITHTFGAVQEAAPHSSGAGHCYDEQDVMCYPDGGPYFRAGGATQTVCNLPFQAYDCNGDDYFNFAPPAGSYLATHWNSARSTYMCPLTRCQTAGAPPIARLAIPSAWSGAPFTLSAAASTDDAGLAGFTWDLNYDGHFDQTTGTNPSLSLTYKDQTPGVEGLVKLGVGAVDIDGALGRAYIQLPIRPPNVFLGGTHTQQKLRTARASGISYSVYGGGGTVRITLTVSSSVKRRFHLPSRTLATSRVLPASIQLAGHVKLKRAILNRLKPARSLRVRMSARLTPLGAGERAATRAANIVLR
ncbi:MAG: hypothetical protein JWN32_562 [Solirubrobacterales bacterium]|nr:hypothetical protein [Solirubrobacterales bacterium]